MASKKTTKGKRYSVEEKQEIIDYVAQINAEKGRGGQTEASKKFGVSPLTISTWIKKGGATKAAKPGRKPGRKAGSKPGRKPASAGRSAKGNIGSVLEQLASLDAEIVAKRQELSDLESKFQSLKNSL